VKMNRCRRDQKSAGVMLIAEVGFPSQNDSRLSTVSGVVLLLLRLVLAVMSLVSGLLWIEA